jgi:glutathione synthase/RimK-type ligase-like ATP-grasp enzyme
LRCRERRLAASATATDSEGGLLALITNREDLTADWLILELNRRRTPFVRMNSEDFPTAASLSWDGCDARLATTDVQITASEVHAVWWRRSVAPVLPVSDRTPIEHAWAVSEAEAAWQGFWRTVEARWVNHPDANAAADHKMVQLRAAADVGFSVPETMVTNDPAVARAFAAAHDDIVCKAGRSGLLEDPSGASEDSRLLYTQRLEQGARAALASIGPEPYLFQRLVPKRFDVRVTVIGDTPFGCRIDSQQAAGAHTDWRAGEIEDLGHTPLPLPDPVAQRCVALTRRFRLRFSAIDLAVTPNDEWMFFEINPNGQWAWIEQLTGQPLAVALADELLGVNR